MALLPPLVGSAAWGGKTTLDLHKGCLDCLRDLMLAQARYLVITPRGLGLPRLPAAPDARPGAALLLREGRARLDVTQATLILPLTLTPNPYPYP